MTRNVRLTRSLALVRVRRQLEQESFPRIQMGLIVSLTGASGWLCSFLLLLAGVETMVLRYPLALAGAYLFFLFLLWLWLRTQAGDHADASDVVDAAADVADLLPVRGTGLQGLPIRTGGGGNFGGGGASASFDDAGASLADSGPLKAVGEAAGSAFDADELAIPLLAIALAVGLALASLYVVYLAPALFAELLFDGVLSYTLYRNLRRSDSRHWLATAVRKTALPFALTAVFLAGVGAAITAYAPGARSIGEAMQQAQGK
jgi:hypothetical protein